MPALWLLLISFGRATARALRDRETRGLVYLTAIIIALGTIFYSQVEGWRVLDSLYFTVITLTTVGYGDFSPQTDAGKLFTIIYLFVGLGLLASFIAQIARQMRQPRKRNGQTPDNNESDI